MASPFAADLGKAVRAVPRGAVALPRTVFRLPGALLKAPSKRTRRRILLGMVLAAILAATYMFWFRSSSLVAVEDVDISGVAHAEEEVSAALTGAAKQMTTLNMDVASLERAVKGYPTVASIAVDPGFPHHLAITVTERVPVATVGAEEGVAVAGDGTVLSGVPATDLELPVIQLKNPPSEGRLEGVARTQAEVMGAAPLPLLPAVKAMAVDKEHGVIAEMVGGIEIRFGDSSNAAAKWAAAAAILANPKLDQLSYIDVRIPGRPAVGGAPLPESAVDDIEEAATAPTAPVPAAPVDPAAAPVDPAAAPLPAAPVPAPDPAATAPPVDPATGVAGATPAP